MASSATRHGVAIAIRQHRALAVKLEDYRSTAVQSLGAEVDRADIDDLLSQKDYPAILSWAVLARKNILISGGTSTGKTTLLNSLLRQIPGDKRPATSYSDRWCR